MEGRTEGQKKDRKLENMLCSVRCVHKCHEFVTYSFNHKHIVQYVLRICKLVNFFLLKGDLSESETFSDLLGFHYTRKRSSLFNFSN